MWWLRRTNVVTDWEQHLVTMSLPRRAFSRWGACGDNQAYCRDQHTQLQSETLLPFRRYLGALRRHTGSAGFWTRYLSWTDLAMCGLWCTGEGTVAEQIGMHWYFYVINVWNQSSRDTWQVHALNIDGILLFTVSMKGMNGCLRKLIKVAKLPLVCNIPIRLSHNGKRQLRQYRNVPIGEPENHKDSVFLTKGISMEQIPLKQEIWMGISGARCAVPA